MAFECDGCGEVLDGPRVVFTTEATDERGIDVVVAKRWVTCRPCAEAVFDRLDEPSPFADDDRRALVLPAEGAVNQHPGGYAAQLRA